MDEPLLRLLMVVGFVLMMLAGLAGWITLLIMVLIWALECAVEAIRDGSVQR